MCMYMIYIDRERDSGEVARKVRKVEQGWSSNNKIWGASLSIRANTINFNFCVRISLALIRRMS